MKKLLHLLLVFLPPFVSAQSPVPVAKYSFNDGTARDEAGSNNAKAVGVSLVNDRFGNPRSAVYLHGTYGSYLNLGTSSVLKPSRGTISMWFNMETITVSGKGGEYNPLIITKSHDGDDFCEGFCIGYNWSAKRISAATTLSEEFQVNLRATDTTRLNRWYHVAITYDDSFLALYIDGELQNRLAKNFHSRFLDGDSIIIGNTANLKNQRFFNGSVDDILIYNDVLSDEDIRQLYNSPNPAGTKWLFKTLIILLAVILFVLLIALYFTKRSKAALEAEKANNILQFKTHEQEIKTLKAQMDPHFIFNALNSIQKFILLNENEKAQLYLTRFSRLLRKILESNTQELISLCDEIDLLTRYIEIESLRFDSNLVPEIMLENNIDPQRTFIPHMLIQPVVENAIWHGLISMREQKPKELKIRFTVTGDKTLTCEVEDNGVGRKKEINQNVIKDRPLALTFIRQRLELLSKIHSVNYDLQIIDKFNNDGSPAGTLVKIIMPVTFK